MKAVASSAFLALLALAALTAAADKQTFTGTITDDMCPKANGRRLRYGVRQRPRRVIPSV
jgi:hypothetical protein